MNGYMQFNGKMGERTEETRNERKDDEPIVCMKAILKSTDKQHSSQPSTRLARLLTCGVLYVCLAVMVT